MSNNLISSAIYLDDVPLEQIKDYLGKGYRSVVYKVDAFRNGQIILFGFNTNGERQTYVFPWKSWVKYNVKFNTSEVDIYGRPVATKYFKNIFERKKWIESSAGIKIVECLRPEQEVLHYLFDYDVLKEDFNKQPLRIHYFDIETEISDQFERPADARNRINMMTIYDSETEKFYTWSLNHAEIDFKEEPLCHYSKDKFVFYEFHDDEAALLRGFLDWYEDNYPDVNFGWNTRAYDWPYVVRRIENVLGPEEAKRLSPVGKYYIKEVNHENKRADVSAEIEVSIDGLFIADGLALYRDKFGISKPDGGFSLDNIGEVEGCGHKIHYNGTLKDLYLKDYQKFYEYNVRDVDLAKRIEDKTKMIPLARTITTFGLCQYPTIYSSLSYLIGSVISFARTEMNCVMCSYVAQKQHFDGFEGAFVFPTQKGIYRKGIGAIDFASLYPSLIQALNASPETYVGKVLIQFANDAGVPFPINETDELYFDIFDDAVAKAPNVLGFVLKTADGHRKNVTLEGLRSWIEKNGIYTANNTIFLKHSLKWGVIAKWCEYFYAQRKMNKNKMLALFHELNNPDNHFSDAEREEKTIAKENYNSRQGAMKNMINSIYGQMGSAYSPIANLDMAQSITRTGRFCNTQASQFVVKRFKEEYDPNYVGYRIKAVRDDSKHWEKAPWIEVAACGGDTDSCTRNSLIHIRYCKNK